MGDIIPIGRQPGTAGSTALSALPPAPRLAPGGNLRALLPPCVRSALRERFEHRLADEYDCRGDGFELIGEVDQVELETARQIVRAALQPPSPDVIERELARLRVKTASRDPGQDDLALTFAVYAEELADYPEDIVVTVCRGWIKRGGKFWPALAELTEPADRLVTERRALADALARGPRRLMPNPEAAKIREAIAKRDRQRAEAATFRVEHPELYNQPALTPMQLLALTQGKALPTVLRIAVGEDDAGPIRDEEQRWLAAMEAAP